MSSPSAAPAVRFVVPRRRRVPIILVGGAVALGALAAGAIAQAQVEAWQARFNRGPGATTDRLASNTDWMGRRGVVVDSVGRVAVTGSANDGSGYDDFVTVRYATNGTLLWTAVFENPAAGSQHDRATAVAVDAAGNTYVTGQSFNGANWDYMTVKYDGAGVEQWATPYSGAASGSDVPRALAVDSAGNVYVTGESYGGATSLDYLTVKYGPSGVPEWEARYNGSGNYDDSTHAIFVDAAGNVYVTGGAFNASTGWDLVTIKYGPTGTPLWTRSFAGTYNYDVAYAVSADAAGSVYVTGYTQTSTYTGDALTIKYDAAGTALWTRTYENPLPGLHHDMTYSHAVDASGNVYATGFTGDTTTNLYDYLTLKYDAAGTLQWAQAFENPAAGSQDDTAYAIALDGLGSVYVVGRSHNGSNQDLVTVRYDGAGIQQWTGTINNGGNDYGTAMAVGPNGSIVVAGTSDGLGQDYVVAKYVVAETAAPTDPTIEGTIPAASTWTNDNTVEVTWSGAVDNPGGSGLAGYSIEWNHTAISTPDAVVDVPHGSDPHSTTSAALAPDGDDWYFHLRTCDLAGNCTSTVHAGPFMIDTVAPANPMNTSFPWHSIGGWSRNPVLEMGWSGASDNPGGSGLAGYSISFDLQPVALPDALIDVPHGADPHAGSSAALADSAGYYAHLRACDLAGNCSAPGRNIGPFHIDATPPTPPGPVTSASHAVGLPSADPTIDGAWGVASDATSGLATYRFGFRTIPIPQGCDGSYAATTATSVSSASLADGTWYLQVCARDVANNESAFGVGGPWIVDTTAPIGLALAASSHAASTWSVDNTIDFIISGATDSNGVAGYSVVFDQLAGTDPGTTIDQTGTTYTGSATTDGSDWYLHVRACDSAGNCGGAVHSGPYWIDTAAPGAPGAVTSLSHGDGQPKGDDTVDIAWGASTDALSGVALYRYGFTNSATPPACGSLATTTATLAGASGNLSDGTWYVHVCAVDHAGNEGAVATGGPYLVDLSPPRVVNVDSVASSGGPIGEAEVLNVAITALLASFDEEMNFASANTLSNYLLVSAGTNGVVDSANCSPSGDDDWVPLDYASYGSPVHTVVLGVNSGVALPDGLYRLFACPALTDLAGNALDGDGNGTGGDAFARTFRVDQTPPQVALVDSVADTGDGIVAENEATAVAITELLVTFSEPVQPASAQAVGNYLLAFGGANGGIDSANCGLGGDDTAIAVDSAAYASGTTTLGIHGGVALGEGRYRLFVCAGVLDLGGNALGGGTAFARSFTVDTTAPGAADPVTSFSHGDGLPKSNGAVDIAWSAASDNLSGVALYRYGFSNSATAPACASLTTTATLAATGNLSDGTWYAHVCAVDQAGNPGPVATGGPYRIDTAPPTGLAVTSTSHAVSSWSNDNGIDFSFSGAPDPNGIVGYSVVFDQLAATDPDTAVDQAGTTFTATASPDGSSWYLHVRACDSAGNCGGAVHSGPYWIDTAAPGAPGAVTSLSHGDGQPKGDDTVDIAWGASTDALSGVALYRYGFTNSATPPACGSLATTTATLAGASGNLSDGTWYAHVCAVDPAENEGAVATGGPYLVDLSPPRVVNVDSVASAGGSLEEGEATNVAITELLLAFDEAMDATLAGAPASYLLVEAGPNGAIETTGCAVGGDDVAAAIDTASYAAGAATLGVNGGAALPDGRYALAACAALQDVAGNALDGDGDTAGGDDFLRAFSVDTAAPGVLATRIADDGRPLSGGLQTNATVTGIEVEFDERMSDPPGDGGAGDVDSPASYRLVFDLAGAFETESCGDGDPGDDADVAIDSVAWQDAARRATVALNGGSALADGGYRFFACGTLADRAGNPLAAELAVDFRIDTQAPALPTILTSTTHAPFAWSGLATLGMLWSGAVDEPAGSGLSHYALALDAVPASVPDGVWILAHGSDPHEVASGPLASGAWYFHLVACDAAGNCAGPRHAGPYLVDFAGPEPPLTVVSPSHDGGPSQDATIEVAWTPALDDASGLAGYGWTFAASSSWACDEVEDGDESASTATSPPLGEGDWYFHLCARDNAGNWGVAGSYGPWAIDTTAPQVASLDSVPEAGLDGVATPSVEAALTQLLVGFSEGMAETGAGAVGDVANWRLVEAGGDAVIDTVACGPLVGDDVAAPLAAVQYDAGTHLAALAVGSGAGLPAGSYRLLACPGLTDAAGNALATAPWTSDFAVAVEPLAANPNFDADLSAWMVTGPVPAELGWLAEDAEAKPFSGAARLDTAAGAGAFWYLETCVVLPAEGDYELSSVARIGSAEPGAPAARVFLTWVDTPTCFGGFTELGDSGVLAGDSGGAWQPLAIPPVAAPPGSGSVWISFLVQGGAASSYTVDLDRVLFAPAHGLFSDDFETGAPCRWAGVVGGPACP